MRRSLLLRSRKAQTEALNEALDSLATDADDPQGLTLEIHWLMEDYVRTSGRLKAAFDKGQRQWTPRPIEDIHEFYTEFLAIVDGQLRLADRVRERALKAAETTHESLDLTPLDESIQSLLKLRENVSGLCEWLISPVAAPFLLPHRTAAERKAAFERGEYESVEDVLNRLRQGGPLVKE